MNMTTPDEKEAHLRPKPDTIKYGELFVAINTGKMKIPLFQRDFVWSKEQTAKLLDSLIKGFPIGTFILWETKDELKHIRDIGNITLPNVTTKPQRCDALASNKVIVYYSGKSASHLSSYEQ